MDDMKRAMYIAARNAIQKGQANFICLALKTDLARQGFQLDLLYPDLSEDYDSVEQLTEELFPEFFQLFDYKLWTEASYGEKRAVFSNNKHNAWFEYQDKDSRLRLLDFIIDNR